MSEEYKRGYGDGFQAGFKMAEKFYQIKYPEYAPNPFTYKNQDSNRCSVCGFTFEQGKIYGYVCGNVKCPSKATCGPMTSTTMGTEI